MENKERNMEYRQQFYERYGDKYEVSSRIQFRSQGTDTVRFSCNRSINHITETTKKVCDIKLR